MTNYQTKISAFIVVKSGNFCLRVCHPSLFDWNFFKIGSVSVKDIRKNAPILQVGESSHIHKSLASSDAIWSFQIVCGTLSSVYNCLLNLFAKDISKMPKINNFCLKSVLFKKILEKPFSTQNLQKLPRHLALISWGSFCKFCVLNGFSRIFLNKTDFRKVCLNYSFCTIPQIPENWGYYRLTHSY